MKNISKDIQSALDSVIEGIEFPIDVEELKPENIKLTMESKTEGFKVSKDLVTKWQKSRNAPSKKVLERYITRIVNAGSDSIETLRSGLRKAIDYSNLDENKHKSAMQSKPILVSAIYEIEAGVFELRHQLETGNFNTEDDEFEIGFPEKFANGEMLDISNYWSNWFNEKEDAIKICPFGTEGKIITLDNVNIQLPKIPKDKSKILFSSLPKEEQYWRRTEVPDGLSKQTKDQYVDYIYEEFRRRVEGVWFMNNGKPEYITGNMYFSLQWCKMIDNGKYMAFREAQRDMFYFSEACIRDTRCLGEIFLKSRRTGFTIEKINTIVNQITMKKNQKAGITSKSDKDAEEAFSKLSYTFLNLPFFFRPVVKGNQESKNKLDFAKPADMSKAGKKKGDLRMDKYLSSEVDFRATNNGSYDSVKLNWYLGDEAAKWKAPNNYETHWGQISPTMDEGGMIVGKAFIGSTCGAMKDGGKAFKSIEEGSRADKRDKITERTPTGLYSYFLPAQKNMTKFIDKYGKCWINPFEGTVYNVNNSKIPNSGSLAYIEATAAAKRREGDNQYNEYMRTFPTQKSDAYRDELAQSDFNLVKIHEQRNFRDSLTKEPVFRGSFSPIEEGDWTKGVTFIPKDDGRFYLTGLPPKELRNRTVFSNGKQYPANGMIFRGGVDSFDTDETVDSSRASSGSLHIKSMNGIMESDIYNDFFYLEYIERPPYADAFYRDVAMAAIFFGAPLLIENNKKLIIDWFKRNGLGGYVMKRPKEFTPPSEVGKRTQRLMDGIPSSGDLVIQGHANALMKYIHYNVGIWSEVDQQMEEENGNTGNRDVGEYGNMFFDRTLEDWGLFNIKNRTKHDATISSGFAEMACNVSYRQLMLAPKKITQPLARTYKRNNDGRYR